MSARASLAVAALAVALPSILAGGQSGPAPYSPRLERPVVTTVTGAQRLAVDVPLLVAAAPFEDVRRTGGPRVLPPRAYGGLSDLRLFAEDGREIGYLLVYGPPAPPLTESLEFERRRSEPGRSRYRVRLPHARLPIVALAIAAGGDRVFRTAFVNESRLAGAEAAPVEIGRATLSRTTRGAAADGRLRIPIVPPREPEIELVVDDGNNPPLDLTGVEAVFAELPWIYFEAPGTAVVARYGDARAAAPLYDLEAARSSLRIEDVPEARWGEPHEITPPAAASARLADTGAPVDPAGFRVQRVLPEAPPGLVALRVDAAILADSRGPDARFADVRIVDAEGRQVPYLVERREEPLTLDLDVKPFEPRARDLKSETGRQRSVYSVRLPYKNLPPLRLVLETSTRVFQRSVQVGTERPPDRRRRDTWFDVLASSSWQHADESAPAPALTLPIHPAGVSELVVLVEEGDNRQLPIVAARALLPSYRLRFYQPSGPLRLLYGRDDLSVPQYDLALLGTQVMGATAREIEAAAPPPPAAPESEPQLVSPLMFWIGLGLAAVVLLGIVVRLMRS
jgi:hypothetical protein